MKKNILIVTNKMVMGGVEKALLGMINLIDSNNYNVTVFLLEEGGELRNNIPKWVNVKILPTINISIKDRILLSIKEGDFIKGISILRYSILTKLTKKSYKGAYYYNKIVNNVEEKYDLAIAYHTPLGFPVTYVIDNIKAKCKVAYIHGDMEQYRDRENFIDILKLYKKYYKKYDKIFCACIDAKNKFLKCYPNLQDKIEIFKNILDINEIEQKSLQSNAFNKELNCINIVTVGRLSYEKGQNLIPNIIKILLEDNINLKWYCIGDGPLRGKLENLINELDIKENFILLGTQNNPYPFIKNSDIYVQTSLFEGFCITLAEAKVLKKPIITTNFVGAKDQIINGKNGLIVEAKESEIYEAIYKLIMDKELRNKFEAELNMNTIDFTKEIYKLYELMQ